MKKRLMTRFDSRAGVFGSILAPVKLALSRPFPFDYNAGNFLSQES